MVMVKRHLKLYSAQVRRCAVVPPIYLAGSIGLVRPACAPRARGYNTRAQPCLKMWRGSPPTDRPPRSSARRSPIHPAVHAPAAACPEGE